LAPQQMAETGGVTLFSIWLDWTRLPPKQTNMTSAYRQFNNLICACLLSLITYLFGYIDSCWNLHNRDQMSVNISTL